MKHVTVKGGTVVLGDGTGTNTARVATFEMAQAVVSVGQFRDFLRDELDFEFPWDTAHPSWEKEEDLPMVNVTQDEAEAFCGWLGGRLPTQAEWILAARGSSTKPYPWGRTFDASRVVCSVAEAVALPQRVASKGKGEANGFLHLVGNVAQWTSTEGGDGVVVKGGAYSDTEPSRFAILNQVQVPPETRASWLGFRVVWDVKPPAPKKRRKR